MAGLTQARGVEVTGTFTRSRHTIMTADAGPGADTTVVEGADEPG